MRDFSHWNARYIFDRISVMFYEYNNPNTPWLTKNMNEILSSILRPSDVGFEWGSGRSTVWFAERIAHLTSIEHDKLWSEKVDLMLREKHLDKKVDYRICQEVNKVNNLPEYVNIINKIEDDSLDFCLVDGIFRDECAIASLSKIKPGGFLIIDDINRYLPHEPKSNSPSSRGLSNEPSLENWTTFMKMVEEWRLIWTTSGVTDTALWIRPYLTITEK